MRKTKIVCTIGPASSDPAVFADMCRAGMNVARLNFSHGTHAEHQAKIDMIKQVREELGLPIAIMLDTKGPEYRIGTFAAGHIELHDGDAFTFTTRPVEGDETIVSVNYAGLPHDLAVGDRVLVNNGLVIFEVQDLTETDVHCRVVVGGELSNRKSMSFPNKVLHQLYLSEQDKDDLLFGIRNGVDFVAASFVSCKQDLLDLRGFLHANGGEDIDIIAKIENRAGVDNIEEISEVCDGIMVARGDLGVEVPFTELPAIQKYLITKCRLLGKRVITATEMLESMIHNPRPTRAEATDVANAIYDGTSAIMLSGETAAGAYPVEAVRTMVRIAERTENDIDYVRQLEQWDVPVQKDVTSAISHATCTTAHDLGAVAIMTVSKTGFTARMISKFRPACPIISGTTDRKVLNQMGLSWGVIPVMLEEKTSTDELFEHIVAVAEEHGLVQAGDIAVITAGIPLGISGTTNMLKVHLVGDVLVSGTVVNELSTCGPLCVCKTEEEALQKFRRGDILVLPKTTNATMPLIRQASGIVTEMDGVNSHAAIAAMALDKPAIVGAAHATDLLRSGTTVKLDGVRGAIFSVSAPSAEK